jgi:hypothetical protein
MATDQADTTQADAREESQDERGARLKLERKALAPSPAHDSLRERLAALLGLNLYGSEYPETAPLPYHERALFRYAAATTKAVAMALQGTEYVTTNEPFDTQFTTEEAATVLCGLSVLLDEAPSLIEDLREATEKQAVRS